MRSSIRNNAQKSNICDTKRERIYLIILLVLAILVRIDFNTWQGIQTFPDTTSYLDYADEILMEGWVIDVQRTPVYPLFLIFSFLMFGYQNLLPVVIIQTLLGIAGVLLFYLLAARFTGRRTLGFILGILFAFHFNVVRFETAILTETLSATLVILSVYLILIMYEKGLRFLHCFLFNTCIGILILLRPIFIVCLAIIPLLIIIQYIRGSSKRSIANLIITFMLCVVVPVMGWMISMKVVHGFFGITNVQQIDAFDMVMEYDMLGYAPEKYNDFLAALKEVQGGLDSKYRTNAFLLVILLDAEIPQEQPGNYEYLTSMAKDIFIAAPFLYIKKSILELPEGFSKIEKGQEYRKTETLVAYVTWLIYRNAVYRLYRDGYVFPLLILMTVLLPVIMCHSHPCRWMTLLFMLLLIWFMTFVLMVLSPGDYDRLRIPVDSLIMLVIYGGLYEVIIKVIGLIRLKKSAQTQGEPSRV